MHTGHYKYLMPYENSTLRIFILDDDRIHLHTLSVFLKKQEFQVATSDRCSTVIADLIEFKPHIIITDYLMSPVDGIEVCKQVRVQEELGWPYIIFVTSDRDLDVLSRAFKAGANDFIYKPLNPIELTARLISAKHTINIIDSHLTEAQNIRKYAFELESATLELQHLATTDPLTGLFNRRYSENRLTQEWNLYLRTQNPFAILSLDLDHFKVINDTYGHDVGDEVLIHFSELIKKSIRVNDVACRMGGEEFIVISPNCDSNTIQLLGNRIQQTIEKTQPVHLQLNHKITVSIGGAISDTMIDLQNWNATLKRSDVAMYQAKTSGRNQFVLYESKIS